MSESPTSPWILRSTCVKEPQDAAGFARTMADRLLFGQVAKLEALPADFHGRVDRIRDYLSPDDPLLERWQCHLAREILLAKHLGKPWAAPIITQFYQWRVFENHAVTLGVLADLPLSVASFPLVEGDSARPCFLWLFGDAEKVIATDHSPRLGLSSSEDGKLSKNSRLFLVESGGRERRINGDSWQLALALATRMLGAEDDIEIFKTLAFDWIASGAVAGNQVRRVDQIAAKCTLRDFRTKLFPSENRDEVSFSRGYGHDHAYFVATTESAWAFVSGTGTINGGTIDWPTPISAMHSFVSGAWPPVISCALLSRPKKIVLWHTDNPTVSENPAKEIEKLLRQKLFPDAPEDFVELRRIPSDNFAEAERVLEPILKRDLANGENVVFNVTQGNRLMSFACFALAPRFPNLSLIYRDLDAPPGIHTLVRFEGTLPTTLLVRPPANDRLRNDIDWEAIFKGPPEKPGDDFETIWEKIRNKDVAT